MFEINFISEPGFQKETSDACWSFLNNQSENDIKEETIISPPKSFFMKQNSWKNYVFVLLTLCLIALMSIINIRYLQINTELMLTQVIDLIIKSDYVNNLQFEEANFSRDKIKVSIRSEELSVIHELSQEHLLTEEIPYQIYQKTGYSYLNLHFPWRSNEKGGNIQVLKSMASAREYSKNIIINHSQDTFEIKGRSSDIISFLLQMAEKKQIQKFYFSVFQNNSGEFNLIVQLKSI